MAGTCGCSRHTPPTLLAALATSPTGHGPRFLGQSVIHFPEGGAEVEIVSP